MLARLVAIAGALAVALTLLNPVAVEAAGRKRTKVSLNVSDRTPIVGQQVTISGKVKPRKAHGKTRRIKLQKRIDGRWKTVRRKKARKSGYSFHVRPQASGTIRYRLRVARARGIKGKNKRFNLGVQGKPSLVTARYSKRRVKIGKKVTVRGYVSGAHSDRVVTLYRALPSGARAIRSKRVNSRGRYVFRVPSWFLVNHRLFVRVAPTRTHAGDNTVARKYTVLPNWKRQGKATSWKSLHSSGRHVRINPCAPVRYRVNMAALRPKGRKAASRDLRKAMHRVTRATGIRFQRVGSTSFIPRARSKSKRRYPGDVRLTISWARQKQTKLNFIPAAAWGGGKAIAATSAKGHPIWLRTKGWVAVEHPSRVPNGFKNGGRRGALLMHEIGHVIGLDHPKAKNQIMSAVMNRHNTSRWSMGDVRGLRAKGIDHGCIAQPRYARTSAQEVELPPQS